MLFDASKRGRHNIAFSAREAYFERNPHTRVEFFFCIYLCIVKMICLIFEVQLLTIVVRNVFVEYLMYSLFACMTAKPKRSSGVYLFTAVELSIIMIAMPE